MVATSVKVLCFIVQCEPSEIVTVWGLELNMLDLALNFLWDQKYTLFSVFNGS